ncbi:MAG: DegT/DnrJ/EryC1/StrS family aminotransferase [Cyanobacteriota bacterium]|nr:DegT/DnrJ/EryC1/StrS family aminotransferase [Cyanobacteriota bacterium]
MDSIPLLDLRQQYQALAPELVPQIEALLASGYYIGGTAVQQFEEAFAQFLGSGSPTPLEVIGCNSGTDALYLALRGLGIQAGDEVLTSAFSFFASTGVISQVGARPVFIDINPQTFNLDPSQIARHITPRTKAIIPVHLFGQPLDMTAVMAIARQHQLAVIEDCAQAVGACWAGQTVGTFGEVGCFSFFPTKNLGAAGDAGAMVVRDPHLAKTLRILKDHGQSQQYRHEVVGINSRLDALQAVILSVKLRHLREWNGRRRSLADSYTHLLHGIPDLLLPSAIVGGNSVWHQYTVRILGDPTRRRDRVRDYLQRIGISSRIYYPVPLHLQAVYHPLGYQVGDYPEAERTAQQVLSLPFFPELTLAQQKRVASGLASAMQATTT